VKKLYLLSGNECAFPGCRQPIISEDGTLVAQIVHIEAAMPGGERYNDAMDDEDRRAFENLTVRFETGDEVQQVLDGSSISLCLDTGHLLIGGTDPAALARQAPARIAHLHLKDVDSTLAAKVRSGRLTYTEPEGEGPVADVRSSAEYLRTILDRSIDGRTDA
jgi:hypothetical protein